MDLFDIAESYESLHAGLSRVNCPVMVIGVQTDILFPIRQQRKLATALQESGNMLLTYSKKLVKTMNHFLDVGRLWTRNSFLYLVKVSIINIELSLFIQ